MMKLSASFRLLPLATLLAGAGAAAALALTGPANHAAAEMNLQSPAGR